MNNYKTFSAKGLTKVQETFLASLENEFLNGAKVSLDLLKKVAYKIPMDKRSEAMEVWNYWKSSTFIPTIERHTLKKPAKISEYLIECNSSDHHAMYLSERGKVNSKYYQIKDSKLENSLAWDLYPYLEKIDNRIYIKYSSIISSTLYFITK